MCAVTVGEDSVLPVGWGGAKLDVHHGGGDSGAPRPRVGQHLPRVAKGSRSKSVEGRAKGRAPVASGPCAGSSSTVHCASKSMTWAVEQIPKPAGWSSHLRRPLGEAACPSELKHCSYGAEDPAGNPAPVGAEKSNREAWTPQPSAQEAAGSLPLGMG